MKYNGAYPLSLKDLTLSKHVTELLELNIASLKIEGRMKSPDYVYGVTSIWRRLLDERRNADKRETERLTELFSRSGFTDGYFTSKLGAHMLGVRTDSDKSASRDNRTRFSERRQLKPRGNPVVLDRLPTALPNSEELELRGTKQRIRPCETAIFRSEGQIPADIKSDIVYLPLESWTPRANGVILPPVIYDSQLEGTAEKLKKAHELGATHALVGNIGHIELAAELGYTLHGSMRFNIQNGMSCRVLLDAGLEDLTLSPELTLPQLRDIVCRYPASVIAYGRLPVMLLEKPLGTSSLVDRMGARFPVIKEGGRDILLNSLPTSMVDEKNRKKLRELGVTRRTLLFTLEPLEVCKRILSGDVPGGEYRRIK